MAALFYALVSPPFEAPDEPNARLPTLLGPAGTMRSGGEPLIAGALGGVTDAFGIEPTVIVRCGKNAPFNRRFAFGTNTPAIVHRGECPTGAYRLVRTAFALMSVVTFCLLFWSRPLMIASIAFPSALFYTTQISTDAVNALINLAAGYCALKRRPYACFALACIALLNDRSAVALLAFAAVNLGCELIPVFHRLLASRGGPLAGLIIGAAVGQAVKLVAGRFTALAEFYINVLYNEQFGNNPIRQAGALFLSAWYLGGGMSFTAFYIEYALFAALLVALFLAPRRWFALPDDGFDQVRFIVSATVLTMAAIVTIIQPLTQARYYMFFVPAVVAAIGGALRVRPSALALAFAGLDIAYALSAAAVS